MSDSDVGLLVLGLVCLVVGLFGVVRGGEDRSPSMTWDIGGFVVFGLGSVSLAALHWAWLIAVMVIGGLTVVVAYFVGQWRDQ